ncbi:MAG: DUF1573 domain-containing protein [Phycisphaerales bacterium]
MLKIVFWVGVAIVFAIAAWWGGSTLRDDQGPPQKDVLHAWDFGTVSIDDGPKTLTHEFLLRNETDSPLTVVQQVPSCTCIQSAVQNPVVPARGTTAVQVQIELARPKVEQQYVTLHMSDGSKQVIVVQATVQKAGRLSVVVETETASTLGGRLLYEHYVDELPDRARVEDVPVEAFECGEWERMTAKDGVPEGRMIYAAPFNVDLAVLSTQRPLRLRFSVGSVAFDEVIVP